MTYDLDTDAFLTAFFRMANGLVYPEEVFTDNAVNFVAADKDLKKLWFNISQERLKRQLADASVDCMEISSTICSSFWASS